MPTPTAPAPPAPAPPRPPVAAKWFFATNLPGLHDYFDLIRVAVTSARVRTTLIPHCLLDPSGDPAPLQPHIAWLRRAGVRIIPHRAALFAPVREHFGPAADRFSGHWLRCDIPVLEHEEDVVLYTDIDVMFLADLPLADHIPPLIACTPEQQRNDFSYFNSGVMVMNLPALRATRGAVFAALQAMLPILQPHDDQAVLNRVYGNHWAHLPDRYNWKPYWGATPEAAIVHFHGIKPDLIRAFHQRVHRRDLAPEHNLFQRAPSGFLHYLALFDHFLAAAAP